MKWHLIFLLLLFSNILPAQAAEWNGYTDSDSLNGVVFLIVDGMGASYIYPEYQPMALDGTYLQKPRIDNLSSIYSDSLRFIDVSTTSLSGNSGHNVLITGVRNADEKLVAYPGTTIYDVLRNCGYVTIAIMEKGDSAEILAKQDIVLHDATDSINDVDFRIKVRQYSDDPCLHTIRDVLETHTQTAPALVEQEQEGSIERYYAYNTIVLDAAEDIILQMESYETPYILTVDAGAIDSAGHYRGNGGYLLTIEEFDSLILPLYELCREKGIMLVITSDNGIAFPDSENKGGVLSGEYPDTSEVKRIPLIIFSPYSKPLEINYPADQQDIAPTLLSLLDIPDDPHFCEGKRLMVKNYAALKITSDDICTIRILKEGKTIYSSNPEKTHYFRKLDLNTSYTLAVFDHAGNFKEKRQVLLDGDSIIHISGDGTSSSGSDKGWLEYCGYILMALINLTGGVMIFRILRE